MTEREATTRFEHKNRPPEVRRFAVRAQWWMSALVGFSWSYALFRLARSLLLRVPLAWCLTTVGAAIALGFLVTRLGAGYFRISSPSSAIRRYRRLGLTSFRRWMVDGDHMNAQARRLLPGYRLVKHDDETLRAYCLRTCFIERAHLIWLAASLPFVVVAALAGSWRWALGLSFLTVVTNLLPVLLQRFNRARCERLLQLLRRQAPRETRAVMKN